MEKVSEDDKNYYRAQLDLGVTYNKKGDTDKSIEYWEKIPKEYEDYYTVQCNIGFAYDKKGDTDKAIEYWKKIPANHLKYFDTQYNLGLTYGEKGNFDNAIECFENIPVGDKNYYTAQLDLGVTYNKKGDTDKAIECWEKIPKECENHYIAQYNIGWAYNKKGDTDKAIEYWEKIPANHLKYFDTLEKLGWAYYKKDDHDKAIECLKQIPENHPNYLTTQYNLVLPYAKKGELDKAIEYGEKFISIVLENGIPGFQALVNMYNLNQEYKFYEDNKFLEYKKKIILQGQQNNKNTLKTFIDEKEQVYNNIRILADGKEQYILYQYMRCSKETLYRIKNDFLAFTNPRYFNDPYDPLIKVLEKTADKKNALLLEKLDFKIACLSKNPKNILMWSHYADRHTGVCVAYDVTELIDNADIVFKKIDFRKYIQRPKDDYMLNIGNVTPTTVLDTFTIKHTDWAYEKEYRFIKMSDDKKQVVPIVGIYLGKDISEENEDLVRHIVDNKVIEAGKEKIEISKLDFGADNVFQLENGI